SVTRNAVIARLDRTGVLSRGTFWRTGLAAHFQLICPDWQINFRHRCYPRPRSQKCLPGVSMSSAPILDNKDPSAPSVFEPAALVREARRQKGLSEAPVPSVCILDPDGDIVRQLRKSGRARLSENWPCYHTELYEFALAGERTGIIGCAVGAPFA